MTEDDLDDLDGTVAWRALLAETVERLRLGGIEAPEAEARWIAEAACGLEGAEFVLGLDELATVRGVAHLDAMVGRRLAGEPVQYVTGSWGFRRLDLLCDRRVLIPRPETEQVVDVALEAFDRVLTSLADADADADADDDDRGDADRGVVIDLGTGSGAIALSVALERPGTEVWAVDVSTDAIAVARANLAGLGMAGSHVRVVEGSWFGAVPDDVAGRVHLIVTNPPYVATTEVLPASVVDWEPSGALLAGEDGLDAYREILADSPRWLVPGGAFVAEIGATQGPALLELARAVGLVDAHIIDDHAGHPRALVAHAPR